MDKVKLKHFAKSSDNEKAYRWVTATRGSTIYFSQEKHENGAASLGQMAFRVLLQNLDMIDAESLRDVPWTIGLKLWKEISKNQLDSIRTWQTFVTAYRDEIVQDRIADLMSYRSSSKVFGGKEIALTPFLEVIQAPKFEWINLVTLASPVLLREQWMSISKLSNLGGLYVYGPVEMYTLDDTVVRAWFNAARDSGAFSALKILLLQSQDRLTLGTLEYFQAFPALRVVLLTGARLNTKGIEDIIQDTRWTWMNKSSLCLEIYQKWHSGSKVFHHDARLRDVYNLVHRKDLGADKCPQSPQLNIKGGIEPSSNLWKRQDQLWFELKPAAECTAKVVTQKRLAVRSEIDSKRLKMRSGAQRSMSDLFGELGGSQKR
ncbi:hypothetical protein BT63DRAFT_427589 [Microthyrium microscopicum]|uniref:Uncharacterized protein n=1 Tax=Microthyrium microscopicum TaxID=703497 RepID=A0A6A6U5K1_9PEZI|nr:hypothetical protein BT63DRAFT_427589 [Microthyrium microscopicum]